MEKVFRDYFGELATSGVTASWYFWLTRGFYNTCHHCQHAEMIRVVVCNQKRFTQDRLAVAMRYLRVQICCRVIDECFHLLQVFMKRLSDPAPRFASNFYAAKKHKKRKRFFLIFELFVPFVATFTQNATSVW